jgi:hypothetical protein
LNSEIEGAMVVRTCNYEWEDNEHTQNIDEETWKMRTWKTEEEITITL